MAAPSLQQLPPELQRRLIVQGDRGCWIWTGYLNERGYGRVSYGGRYPYVHRLVWTLLADAIPVDRELDHLCKVKACANPAHLEPVTHQVNFERSLGELRAAAKLRVKSHCKRGHPLSGDNLYVVPKTGERCCRECRRAEARERYRRKVIRESGSHFFATGFLEP